MPLHFTQLPATLIDAAGTDQILTANERLAREFAAAYDERQIELGRSAWPQPQVAGIDRYWQQQFAAQATVTAPELLSREAELLLWRELTDAQHGHLAELAVEAWRLAHSWRIDLDADMQPAAAGALFFQRWARRFQQRLRQDGLITDAQLPDHLEVEGGGLHLLGFDQLNLQQADFLARCEKTGASVHRHQSPCRPAQTERRVQFDRRADEIRAAAQWSRQMLREDSNARIGIVLPYLADAYHPIRHAFQAEFADAPNAYDIAGGAALADQPVWRSAERLLQHLAAPTLERREALLRAPFLRLGCKQLAAWEAEAAPPQQQSLADWMRGFAATLRRAGWGSNVGSVQQQAQQAIAKHLDQYAELAQLPAIDRQQALQTLRELLVQSPFAAERPSAPILALGYLETTGLHFSHLWVAGMTDTGWPMSRSATPLLPLPLLRHRGVPRIDPAAEAEFAQQRLDQWRNSCRHLVASWTSEDDGGQHLCSALIESFQEARVEDVIPQHRRLWHPWLAQPPRVELQPAPADQATPREDEQLSGGAALLRDQARCPFKAWAQHRLGLRPPQGADLLPDAAARGTLVHSALFALYDSNEAPFSETALNAAAAAAIDEHLAEVPKIYRQNEHRRLLALLERWLECEAERRDFTVLELEQEVRLTLAGAEFKLQVDRIDRDEAEDRLLIIDYKTGDVLPKRLLEERLTEPQLPMYALTDERIGGVLFAKVGSEEAKIDGIAEQALEVGRPVEKEAWKELVRQWRSRLEELLQEHRAGRAAVDPYPSPREACRHCHLPALCRINALQRATPA